MLSAHEADFEPDEFTEGGLDRSSICCNNSRLERFRPLFPSCGLSVHESSAGRSLRMHSGVWSERGMKL